MVAEVYGKTHNETLANVGAEALANTVIDVVEEALVQSQDTFDTVAEA